jgi:hypothetical protein
VRKLFLALWLILLVAAMALPGVANLLSPSASAGFVEDYHSRQMLILKQEEVKQLRRIANALEKQCQ